MRKTQRLVMCMLRRFVAVMVVAAMLLPGAVFTNQALAQDRDTDYVLNRLRSIDFGEGNNVRFYPADDTATRTLNSPGTLYFDSIEEAEEFIRDFLNRDTGDCNMYLYYEMLELIMQETDGSHYENIAPFQHFQRSISWNGGRATQHIAFSFWRPPGTVHPQDTRVVTSWITGWDINYTWTHRYGNANGISHGNTAMIGLFVTGTWTFTMSIFGGTIVTHTNESWERAAHSGVDF